MGDALVVDTISVAAKAAEMARKACELDPRNGMCESTLGVAHYRTEQWKESIDALTKSIDHGFDVAHNWLFIAMANWKLDQQEEAKKWYDKSRTWKQKNPEELNNDAELQSFFAEAEKLMGEPALPAADSTAQPEINESGDADSKDEGEYEQPNSAETTSGGKERSDSN